MHVASLREVPPEIWHGICSCLDSRAVGVFRLVCRAFRDIGDCHAFRTLVVIPELDDLRFILGLLRKPSIAKNVKSLIYQADYVYSPRDAPGVIYEEWRAREQQELMRSPFSRQSPSFEAEIWRHYLEYVEAEKKSIRMLKWDLDRVFLRRIIANLPALSRVALRCGIYGSIHSEDPAMLTRRKGKKSCTSWPRRVAVDGFHGQLGRREFGFLSQALEGAACTRDLRALQLGLFSHTNFDSPSSLLKLAKSLTSLSILEMVVDPRYHRGDYDDFVEFEEIWTECRETIAKGVLSQFLALLGGLEVIILWFSINRFYHEVPEDDGSLFPACLNDILAPGHHWPNLATLDLNNVECTRQDLLGVLLLHRATLRSLRLRNMSLRDTSWLLLLPEIPANLQLEDAEVSGDLFGTSERHPHSREHWAFWDSEEPREDDLLRPLVGKYLVEGGVCPLHEVPRPFDRTGLYYPPAVPMPTRSQFSRHVVYLERSGEVYGVNFDNGFNDDNSDGDDDEDVDEGGDNFDDNYDDDDSEVYGDNPDDDYDDDHNDNNGDDHDNDNGDEDRDGYGYCLGDYYDDTSENDQLGDDRYGTYNEDESDCSKTV